MTTAAAPVQNVAAKSQTVSNATQARLLLQRTCACGSPTASLTGECTECASKKFLQPKLTIGASNDPLEQEADRVADQVLATPVSAAVSAARPRIQRFSGQATGQADAAPAPASVDRVLASPGRPLDPALQQDMEQRFGHDFSQVRVHADAAAERSARDVHAHAYTVGRDVVFATGQFAPATPGGRRLLAHELTHVVQQTGAGLVRRKAVTKALVPGMDDEDQTRREQDESASPVPSRTWGAQVLQRDFALEPPRPRAEGRVLSEADMQAAIAFNQRVVSVIGATGIRELRDVLGVSPDPAVIDEDFVRAVVDWQAVQAIGQDGRLGPATARRLFREIGAEDVGRGELVSGPAYRATTSLTPPVVAGRQQASFRIEAEFADDPANGLYASCCEVRQFIQWDAAYAAAGPGGPPHGGFPAATPADTWVEDRDTADLRYGHRSGAHAESIDGNTYLDNTGNRNPAFGHLYRGRDNSGSVRNAGHWRFFVRAYDVCNGNRALGTDYLRITW